MTGLTCTELRNENNKITTSNGYGSQKSGI
jgi:hypothetical protein